MSSSVAVSAAFSSISEGMGVATLFLSAMYVGKVRFRAGLKRAVEAGKRLVRHEDQAGYGKANPDSIAGR